MACSREAASEVAECGDCGTTMEKLYWKQFVPLHFCQILAPDTGFHDHLEIPKKFAKNTGVRLHDEITLRGPSGATWHAIMDTTGDKVFLSDGWEEFARAHSLQEGDILVFKYDRISAFDVLIFDGDCLCEKEAAYFVQKCENAKPFADHKRKRISDEADMDEPNDVRVHEATKKARKEVRKQKGAKMSKFSHLYFNHRRRKRAHLKSVSAKMTKAIRQNSSVNASNRNDEEPQNTETDGNFETETATPNGNDIHRTFATEPLPDATVIHGGGWISGDDPPAEDAPQIEEITVIDASPLAGKETEEGPSYSERRLTRQQPVIKGDSSGNADSPSRNCPSGEDASEMAHDRVTESSFRVTMRPSAVQKGFTVHIPVPWYKRHLSLEIQNALLRVGDKTWPARLYHRANGPRGAITTGWECFARENWLDEGGVCLFDLASQTGDTVVLDVSIFRARADTREDSETEESSSTI